MPGAPARDSGAHGPEPGGQARLRHGREPEGSDSRSRGDSPSRGWWSPSPPGTRTGWPRRSTGSAAEGLTVHPYVVDVTEAAQLESTAARTATEQGGLDLVVANAGGSRGGGLQTSSADDWTHTLQLNVVHAATADPSGVAVAVRLRVTGSALGDRLHQRLEAKDDLVVLRREGRRDPPRAVARRRAGSRADPGEHPQPRLGAVRGRAVGPDPRRRPRGPRAVRCRQPPRRPVRDAWRRWPMWPASCSALGRAASTGPTSPSTGPRIGRRTAPSIPEASPGSVAGSVPK